MVCGEQDNNEGFCAPQLQCLQLCPGGGEKGRRIGEISLTFQRYGILDAKRQ